MLKHKLVQPDKLIMSYLKRKQVTLNLFSLLCILIVFHLMTQQFVSGMAFFSLQCNLIAFYPMTNSMLVTIYFSLSQSHCISSNDQQEVSHTAFFSLQWVSLWHLIPWPTGSEWHCIFLLYNAWLDFYPMTNSMWVTLYFVFAMESHCNSSHD